MYINGKAKIGFKDGKKYEISILMADIFDTNNCFKAMLMCRFDDELELPTKKDVEIEIFEALSCCDYFECINLDFGNLFNVKMYDFYSEIDYCSGDIFRIFISNEDESDTEVSIKTK